MGRRSRQRASAPPRARTPAPPSAGTPASVGTPPSPGTPPSAGTPAPPARAPLSTASRRGRRESAPRPPWGSFPLVELCALAALVLGAWGIVRGGHDGFVLVTAAMLLGSVAGLEVALREHFGGYRSHTLVLSGVVAIATVAVLFYAGATRTVLIAGAAGGLVVAIVAFRELFKRRSGGVGMRVR
jgi:hypothetical protein